jgi:hypothetical protein
MVEITVCLYQAMSVYRKTWSRKQEESAMRIGRHTELALDSVSAKQYPWTGVDHSIVALGKEHYVNS